MIQSAAGQSDFERSGRSGRSWKQARAEELESDARQLKSRIRELRSELNQVKAEQARVLGITVITKPRRQGDHSNSSQGVNAGQGQGEG